VRHRQRAGPCAGVRDPRGRGRRSASRHHGGVEGHGRGRPGRVRPRRRGGGRVRPALRGVRPAARLVRPWRQRRDETATHDPARGRVVTAIGAPNGAALAGTRTEVARLHGELVRYGLVAWTAGNVSGRVPGTDLFVIKPSGVPYDELTPE